MKSRRKIDKNALLAEVLSAQGEVTKAQSSLAKLLAELQMGSRAEKTTISKGLEAAFETLRAARQQLVVLEELTRADDGT